MTDEQRAVIRQLLANYGDLAWAKTKIKHMDIYIPNALNVSFSISAFEFEKDYICGHTCERVYRLK